MAVRNSGLRSTIISNDATSTRLRPLLFLGEIKRLVGLRQQVRHVERGLLAIGQTYTHSRGDRATVDFLGAVSEALANALDGPKQRYTFEKLAALTGS